MSYADNKQQWSWTLKDMKDKNLNIITYILCYYPVDISTTVFSYSSAVQYHTILHGCYCTGPGAMRYPGKQVARMRIRIA